MISLKRPKNPIQSPKVKVKTKVRSMFRPNKESRLRLRRSDKKRRGKLIGKSKYVNR